MNLTNRNGWRGKTSTTTETTRLQNDKAWVSMIWGLSLIILWYKKYIDLISVLVPSRELPGHLEYPKRTEVTEVFFDIHRKLLSTLPEFILMVGDRTNPVIRRLEFSVPPHSSPTLGKTEGLETEFNNNDQWLSEPYLRNETSIKNPKWWNSESFWLVNASLCQGTRQLHGYRSLCPEALPNATLCTSSAGCSSRSFMILFIKTSKHR